MDLSALIFVALAVAWAVYLIPKALKHHEDDARSRTVDRFSDTLRVLARREPTSRSTARLVVTPGKPANTAVPATPAQPVHRPQPVEPTRAERHVRRQAAARAAKKRLRVVTLILAANVVVAALAAFSMVAWPYLAIPAAVLVGWLVACRLMVKRERTADVQSSRLPSSRLPLVVPTEDEDAGPATEEIVAVTDEPDEVEVERDPGSWDPVPVTLPTYVTKEQAKSRTVRTIDLDSTGVWTSGRSDADSQIVRDADEAERVAKATHQDPSKGPSTDTERRRATGS